MGEKKDSGINPYTSCMNFRHKPSHPVTNVVPNSLRSSSCSSPHMPGSSDSHCGLAILPGMCTMVKRGRDFKTHGLKSHDEILRGGWRRWTVCSRALRTEVPKMNFFFLESIVYFSKYDVNQRTRDSQSQDKKKQPGDLMKFIVLQPFKYF